MSEVSGNPVERATQSRHERAVAAFRALRRCGTSEAEQAWSIAVDRLLADAQRWPRLTIDLGTALGVEEETTPRVGGVRRRPFPHP
jgi:hypothetical protein